MVRYCLLGLALALVAGSLSAVPIKLEYTVTGSGPYTYNFTMTLDNNDSTWTAGSNQGWTWLIFGDANGTASPLTAWTLTSVVPQPWTGMSSSGGGHNGPTFSPVTGVYWVPTALNETRTWSGTSTANLTQGQMLWSTLIVQNGAVAANFTVATRIDAGLSVTNVAGTQTGVDYNAQGAGGNGVVAGRFSIASNNFAGATLNTISIQAAGTGNDQTGLNYVAIFRDDGDNIFNVADTQIGSTAVGFPADNGTASFTVQTGQNSFSTNETRTYWIVVKMSGSASPGHTFTQRVSDIGVGGSTSKSGVPSALNNGLIINTHNFVFTDASAATAANAAIGSSGNVCQTFTVSYATGPDDKPASITITGLGTADESTDLSDVELWHDSDSSGDFDAGLDTLVANGSYTLDNGTVVFSMATHADFQAGNTRTFFVVYDLNLAGSQNETFSCYVSAAANGAAGGVASGLPTPSVSGTAGLVVSANSLTVTLNGPGAATAVNNNAAGATGHGELLCDVTLSAAPGGDWTINTMTFVATGTGSHSTAFSQVALYRDDGNGTWDGATIDTLETTAASGFSGSNDVGFNTTASAPIAAGTSRRFFLVGILNGSATTGQTFNARLDAITATPPTGGQSFGVPTSNSTALVIAASVLSVANAPTAPGTYTHDSGTALAHPIARFRLTASNDAIDVSAVVLTTAGSGNWTTDVTTVEVWLDNGDGLFNAGTDTSLFSGLGGATINALFTGTVTVPNSGTRDLWVVVNLTATAGAGLSSPVTFSLSILATTDVTATSTVVLGTPLPASATLRAVDFFVTSFAPVADILAGGLPITIVGSGFIAPVTVTINGVVCPGTAVVTPTQITGLIVPPGSGTNRPIVLTNSGMAPLTLTQTFSYGSGGLTSSGGGKGGGGGGCAAETGTGAAVILLGLLAAAARRRRKAAAGR